MMGDDGACCMQQQQQQLAGERERKGLFVVQERDSRHRDSTYLPSSALPHHHPILLVYSMEIKLILLRVQKSVLLVLLLLPLLLPQQGSKI